MDIEKIRAFLTLAQYKNFSEAADALYISQPALSKQIRTLEEQLTLLAERYESYQKHGSAFPHEIGLFLEYPLADIEGFIEHQGKDALESGYWKVYGDVEQARAAFRLYDELKAALTTMLAAGVSFRECCAAQAAA